MFFRKVRQFGSGLHSPAPQRQGPAAESGSFLIDFGMLTKGHIIKRGRSQVRQIGVTVNGATRLVTSGEYVDRETLDALIAIGAVNPPSPGPAPAADGEAALPGT